MSIPTFTGGSSIVNVGSAAALTAHYPVAYTASKWGLRGLTHVAATEYGPRGIRAAQLARRQRKEAVERLVIDAIRIRPARPEVAEIDALDPILTKILTELDQALARLLQYRFTQGVEDQRTFTLGRVVALSFSYNVF